MSDIQRLPMGGRIFRLVLAGLALLVAAIQLNDPDPVYWVVVYASTSVVVASQAFARFSRFWSALVLGAILAGMLMTVSGFAAYIQSGDFASITGEMLVSKPYVEQAREFIGLALALTAVAWCHRAH